MSEWFLETARLRLRSLTLDDAPLLFELDSDPEVMRYLSGGPGTPLAKIRDEVLPRFIGYYGRAPWAGVWAAELAQTGEFAGWCSLRPDDEIELGGDLGYRLKRAHWGTGLATEGAAALVARGFELGMPRVVGTTYEHNHASRRVMEKVGMRFVRSFRLSPEELAAPGTFATDATAEWDGDEVEYVLNRTEWLASGRGQNLDATSP